MIFFLAEGGDYIRIFKRARVVWKNRNFIFSKQNKEALVYVIQSAGYNTKKFGGGSRMFS